MPVSGHKRPAYLAYQMIWSSLDWLFPPQCGGCGAAGVRFCRACLEQVVLLPDQICPCCGNPQKSRQLCPTCRKVAPAYDAVRSWAEFQGPLREAMHRLKYRRDVGLGDALAQPLIEFFCQLGWEVNLILPVPLSQERLSQRGYNQAGLIARPLAYATGCPYQPGVLKRIRNTATQVGLSIEERRLNVAEAFIADPRCVNGSSVLIVDDVATTGATLDACARALKKAGARCVYGLTLARAIAPQDRDDLSRGSRDISLELNALT